MTELLTPLSKEQVRCLNAGDTLRISGIAMTGRDAAHKYMVETLIEGKMPLSPDDRCMYDELLSILNGGIIFHAGPIARREEGRWSFVSSGPTTSIREEIYQDKVIREFGVRIIIGKGGMGARTLEACREYGAVYVHAIGGAGVLNAASVAEVIDVYREHQLGLPEAFWKIRLKGFPGIVTMDAHGRSLHEELGEQFDMRLKSLLIADS